MPIEVNNNALDKHFYFSNLKQTWPPLFTTGNKNFICYLKLYATAKSFTINGNRVSVLSQKPIGIILHFF